MRLVTVFLTAVLASAGCGKSVDALLRDLESSDRHSRRAAAHRLGVLKHPDGTEPLARLLNDEERFVRSMAAWAIWQIGSPSSFQAMADVLDSKEKESTLRHLAARFFGKLGDPRATDLLLSALKDDDDYIRFPAAQALGNIGAEKAVGALKETLHRDEVMRVKVWAAFALVKIANDDEAYEYLVSALKNGDGGACLHAATALGELGEERSVEPLIEAMETAFWLRVWANDALQYITKQSIGGDFKGGKKLCDVWEDWYLKKKLGKRYGSFSG
jgi:HEAT repeat protein